jgi:hypothetical protein
MQSGVWRKKSMLNISKMRMDGVQKCSHAYAPMYNSNKTSVPFFLSLFFLSLSSHTGAKIYCLLLSLHGKKVLFPSFTFPLSLPLQDKWQHISCVCIHTRRVVYSGCSPRLFVSGDSVRRQRPVFITLRPAYFKLSISFIGARAWPIFGK